MSGNEFYAVNSAHDDCDVMVSYRLRARGIHTDPGPDQPAKRCPSALAADQAVSV
jgi:hypothetical protein